MRDVINCIKKYIKITNNEKFIRHWKELSEKLIMGIQNSYSNREDNIVKIIESIINSVGTVGTQGKWQKFSISTNSVFIHGNKSQVEFNYYGKNPQRELGDIIFILSVVYNGRKYFEKMTINQVKKSKDASWRFYSDSAKEQVYLLSRFPTFKGAKGLLIPQKEYNLPNNSGCLGTHGLLYSPGDFALISSKELEVLLSKKKTIRLNDLLGLEKKAIQTMLYPCCLLSDYDIEECFYIFHKLIHHLPRYYRCFPFICDLPVLGNDCISYNSYDFSKKYLLGHIGELIYAEELPYNSSAFQFLQDLLNAVRRKAEIERAKDVLNFISSFYYYGYSDRGGESYGEGDYEGGGIGIIHTMVNLGKGE
jgi:hypothetical protein